MESQINQVLIDGLHLSNLIDVWIFFSAIHYMVMIKLRLKLPIAENERYRRPLRYDHQQMDVTTAYAPFLEQTLPE